MARVEAVELVAYGLKCDQVSCDKLFPTRNPQSQVEGYYIQQLERVGDTGSSRKSGELFFCTKDCLIEAVKWQISHLIS